MSLTDNVQLAEFGRGSSYMASPEDTCKLIEALPAVVRVAPYSTDMRTLVLVHMFSNLLVVSFGLWHVLA